MKETFVDATGAFLARRVFAFGSHPQATDEQAHAITTAYAGVDTTEAIRCDAMTNDCVNANSSNLSAPNTNHIRVIFSKLLLPNPLEEIECADGSFQEVPVGATPDDIAGCSVPPDVLPQTCKGKYAVCLCQDDAGCTVVTPTNPTPLMFQKGQPVGVKDDNGDGAADIFKFVPGVAGIQCGTIPVPLDLDTHNSPAAQLFTYYNPSGNQEVPATGGFEALGPAIILKPFGPMPTNLTCGLTFSSDVTDKSNEQVCAPVGGMPADGSKPGTCTPGDVSAFSFKTEPLRTEPDGAHLEGMTGVDRTLDLTLSPNVPVDPATIMGITVAPTTTFTITQDTGGNIVVTWTGGLAANTMYTVTVPATLTDTFAQPLPAPFVLHFTTGS